MCNREDNILELTHINAEGLAYMVEVSEKHDTKRVAVASGEIILKPETIKTLQEGNIKKALSLWQTLRYQETSPIE